MNPLLITSALEVELLGVLQPYKMKRYRYLREQLRLEKSKPIGEASFWLFNQYKLLWRLSHGLALLIVATMHTRTNAINTATTKSFPIKSLAMLILAQMHEHTHTYVILPPPIDANKAVSQLSPCQIHLTKTTNFVPGLTERYNQFRCVAFN